MGYVFTAKDAQEYEQWATDPANRVVIDMESQLMLSLLDPAPMDSILAIGCGTGIRFEPLIQKGLNVTGVDPSPAMLNLAGARFGNRVDLYKGYAEALPFEDNAFNLACLVTTLEFVDNPEKALEEACRVAKDRVFIGFLNRYAIKGLERRVKGLFSKSIYNHAQFFSVWELKRMVRRTAGNVPMRWRSICHLPGTPGSVRHWIERSWMLQRCPFGAFAGMIISPAPQFRTRPLPLRYKAKHSTQTVINLGWPASQLTKHPHDI
jgi:ubiquinone/menaquinone biosynthesis C-methylase UbiE